MSEEQATYESILARVPEVTWAMPDEVPDHTHLANKFEYTDDALRKAAEIMWLVARERSAFVQPYVPDPLWLETEIAVLRDILRDGPVSGSEQETIRWRALEIQNLPRIEASSSQARERTERFSA